MAETLVVELTASGAAGTEYAAGQRLILPAPTARYFARNGWAVVLDPESEEA